MLIATTVTILFLTAGIAAALSLLDTCLRAKGAYSALKAEQALLDAGFIPQVAAQELRLRNSMYYAAPDGARRARHRAMDLDRQAIALIG